jgi:hypothetical protein
MHEGVDAPDGQATAFEAPLGCKVGEENRVLRIPPLDVRLIPHARPNEIDGCISESVEQ